MKSLVFFNNKGGVGKTSLVYHLSWILCDLGYRVIAADLDPQANLSTMFLYDERLENLWEDEEQDSTILGALNPMIKGTGDISDIHIEELNDTLGLLVGNLGLSKFEDKLSHNWPLCLSGDEAAFRVTSSFYRILVSASDRFKADIVLVDVGPNLGAINRAAILAVENIIIPMVPDLFSLQGLKNLGPTLIQWRKDWKDRLERKPKSIDLPNNNMNPKGYIIQQHRVRLDRPVKAYDKWGQKIPVVFHDMVLGDTKKYLSGLDNDPFNLYPLKHYSSLMPMAMEVKKPIFHLLPADGAIGAHFQAVQNCRKDFESLAHVVIEKCDI